jgi:hypothetical protein
MHAGLPAFVLQMPDGDRVLPVKEAQEAGVKEVVLKSMDPVLGQCERGLSSSRRRGARVRSSWSSRSSSRPKGTAHLSGGRSRANKKHVRNKQLGWVPARGSRGDDPNS